MQADRAEANQDRPPDLAPWWTRHIEEPKVAFRIAILRALRVMNVCLDLSVWGVRCILAETASGGNAGCAVSPLIQQRF